MNRLSLIKKRLNPFKFYSPVKAYDKWALNYDNETDNLMLYYDARIQERLFSHIDLKDKNVLDFGCGTGRNIENLLKRKPASLKGCDVSKEMLLRLKEKYPEADVHFLKNDSLDFLKGKSIDLILSTLVIAHIKDAAPVFKEWDKVLRNEAGILITDFHPLLLEKGGERTFRHKGRTIKIRNYVHHIAEVENLLKPYGFKTIEFTEHKIDEEVKSFYEKHKALGVYNKYYGIPFIYGMYMKR